jgi:hypothetical protein
MIAIIQRVQEKINLFLSYYLRFLIVWYKNILQEIKMEKIIEDYPL